MQEQEQLPKEFKIWPNLWQSVTISSKL